LPEDTPLNDLLFAHNLHERLRELTEVLQEDSPEHIARRECTALLNEISLYQHLLICATRRSESARVLLAMRGLRDGSIEEPAWLAARYMDLFGARLDMHATHLSSPESGVELLLIEDIAAELVQGEAGLHVFVSPKGLAPVSVKSALLETQTDPRSAWTALDRADGSAGQVLRVYDLEAAALDFRAGLACAGAPDAGDLRRFLTAVLSRPAEWGA
jgi:hypothetical protein